MQTITVDAKTFEKVLSKLDLLTREIEILKRRLSKNEPTYGSDEWWKKEIKQAEEELKKGKGVRFESVEDAVKWLNS